MLDEKEDSNFVIDPELVLNETTNTLKSLIEKDVANKEEMQKAQEIVATIDTNYKELVNSDFDFAHNNIKTLITKGMSIVNTLLISAQADDNPASYDVAIEFIKTMANLNVQIVDLHFRHEKSKTARNTTIKTATPTISPNGITNNNLFVGTPSDFIKMLEGRMNGNE